MMRPNERGGATKADARARSEWRSLPNAISLTRFPLAVAFVLVPAAPVRLALITAAAASDWIDGRLARSTGRVTRVGELLDPVADKTFMLAAVGALVLEGYLAAWMLPLLLLRDLGVIVGAGVALARRPHLRLPARAPGKVVTYLQFLATGAILLRPGSARWIVAVVAALGLYALADYARALMGPMRPIDR